MKAQSLNIEILMMRNASQYIVRSNGQEAQFILEADAQRYANILGGTDVTYPVHKAIA